MKEGLVGFGFHLLSLPRSLYLKPREVYSPVPESCLLPPERLWTEVRGLPWVFSPGPTEKRRRDWTHHHLHRVTGWGAGSPTVLGRTGD